MNHLQLIGSFQDPLEALKFLETHTADIIIVDILMPVMNGYEFVRELKKFRKTPVIILSSLFTDNDTQKVAKAKEVGAECILQKPIGFTSESQLHANNLIKKIQKIYKHGSCKSDDTSIIPIKNQKYKLVVIGASLGGPEALKTIIKSLPKNFPLPIIIVQHIEGSYDEGFKKWLSNFSDLPLCFPIEGKRPQPGTIYLAPRNKHTIITKNGDFAFIKGPSENNLIPSVGILFESVAQNIGSNCIAILLTGMGKDGAEALLKLKKMGAYTIVQDKENCVMFGMPKAAIELGATTKIVKLNEISTELKKLVF